MAKNDEAIKRLWNTHTQTEIGLEVGMSPSGIHMAAKRLGLPKNPNSGRWRPELRPGPSTARRDQVLALWNDHTASEIGRILGITRERVRQIANEWAFPTNPNRYRRDSIYPPPVCLICGEEIPLTPSGKRSTRVMHEECKREASSGAIAYWMKVRNPRLTWEKISETLNQCDGFYALRSAKVYAKRKGLQWPLVHGRKGFRGKNAS